jgi:hypothetical protein
VRLVTLLALSAWPLLAVRADVVITEIMYHPDSDQEWEEYLELTNAGTEEVDLDGWQFSEGISFQFHGATPLLEGERIVVCRDMAAFDAVYPGVRRAGNWAGRLSNGGERVTLIDALGQVADTVSYGDQEPWSPRADGDGQSLECIAPTLDNDTPLNWRASAWGVHGTPGAPNTVEQPDIPPLLTDLQHSPAAPPPGEPFTVSVRVAGYPAAVTLLPVSRESVAMNDDGVEGDLVAHDGVWSGLLTAPPPGERLHWHVEAHGTNGLIGRAPEYAPLERDGIFIPPNAGPVDLPVWRLWLDPADLAAIRADPQSDVRRLAGLAVGGTYFEPVWVRPRGTVSRRYPKLSWKIALPEWREFEDEQTFNLNAEYPDKTLMRELLTAQFYEEVGVPVSHASPVRLLINGEYHGLHVRFENVGRRWLRRRGFDDNADLFAARRGMFQPATMGYLKYRWDREIDATGEAGWQALCDAVNTASDTSIASAEWVSAVCRDFARDSFLDYLAARACVQSFDDKNKNLFLYSLETPDGPRWMPIPFDFDLSFGRMFLPSEPDAIFNDRLVTDLPALWAGFPPDDENPLYRRLEEIPGLRDDVYRGIGQLLEGPFRLTLLGPEMDALHALITPAALEDPLRWGSDAEFLGGAEELKTFVRLRREALASEVPAEFIPICPERLADHILGIEPLVGHEWDAGDLNQDGIVDISDLVCATGVSH